MQPVDFIEVLPLFNLFACEKILPEVQHHSTRDPYLFEGGDEVVPVPPEGHVAYERCTSLDGLGILKHA